uniref:Uncharacterized protein n=1 Tax=Anguilla anguilla TaxID=7936 RepID=A0A0E9XMA0_ANGAN
MDGPLLCNYGLRQNTYTGSSVCSRDLKFKSRCVFTHLSTRLALVSACLVSTA